MKESKTPKRSVRRENTPQRVENAAEQMRNTGSFGSFRGYVPERSSNQSSRQLMQNPPHATPQAFSGTGQRGFTISPPAGKPGRRKKTAWIIILTVASLLLVAGIAFAGVHISRDMAEKKKISDKVTPYDNLYCPNVYVDGIHLGGMTPEQAMNSVQSQIRQRHDGWKVQLVYEGKIVAEITTDTLNMNLDQNALNAVMNEAWKPGHCDGEGNPLSQADRYAQMEALEAAPYVAYTARPSGDTGEIDKLLAGLKAEIDIPARNAEMTGFDWERAYPFIMTNEVVGRNLDIGPVLDQLYKMVSTMESGTVELVPEIIEPSVRRADLEQKYALRATATTPIDRHSTDDRNRNIQRCFELVTGKELKPGESFSFNKTVGERSAENGFYPATEYINDEHVIGIGGGACQASTTIYQAAVKAGLQIVSRRPHSDSVSYAGYGEDATVYMGGKQIDLVFKNNTDDTMYITAEVITDPSNKQRLLAKVNIYGPSLGNVEYRLETETVETLPSIMEPVYVQDKESAAKAKDGCIVNSWRTTYIDGVPVSREFLFKDTYNPKPQKIYDPNH